MGASPSTVREKGDDLRKFWNSSHTSDESVKEDIVEMKKKKKLLLDATTSDDDMTADLNANSVEQLTREQFSDWKHFSKITCILVWNEYLFTSSLDKYICKWSATGTSAAVWKGGSSSSLTSSSSSSSLPSPLSSSSTSKQCLQVYWGHSKAVTSVFMKRNDVNIEEDDHSNDNCATLYSTSNDCTVRAWNIETGECIRVYQGSENWLTCGVATSQYVCAAGYDCNIHIFDEKTGKRLHQLKGHSKRIEHLVISTESDILYSASADHTIRVWDIESGDCMKVYSFRDHCLKIALYERKNLLLCGLFEEVSVLDLCEKRNFAPIVGINSFTTFEQYVVGWNTDQKTFQVWDIQNGKLIHSEKCPKAGKMISTPCLTYKNNKLYYVKGTTVHSVSLTIPTVDGRVPKKKGKQSTSSIIAETPTYMSYPELFSYFTDILLLPSKQTADLIAELVAERSLKTDMNLDSQIEVITNRLPQLETKSKKREGKRVIREDQPFILGMSTSTDTLDFLIEVNPYDPKGYLASENGDVLHVGEDDIYSGEERLLDFETRTELFYSKLRPESTEVQQPTVVLVRRSDLVFDACKHFSTMTQSDLRKPMYIFFANEPGLDMGGVTREFYRLLSEQILDSNNALFLKTGVNGTYHPNPTSAINEDHLQYFKFIGKLVGKCLYDMNLMDTHFSRVIFKLIVGKPIQFEDLESCDPSMYMAMRAILNCEQVEHMYLNFSAELNDFGSNNTFPLVEDGEAIPVTNENRRDFVELYSRWKLVESVRLQLTLFLSGLYSIIPRPYFSIFSESELELLLCGRPEISVPDWQQFCKYEAGFSESHPTVNHFWKMVGEMSHTQRSRLLQYVTGTSCVPPEGFRGFYPHFTICCVRVHKNAEKNKYLPVAHTCLNRIDFPAYDVTDREDFDPNSTSSGITVGGMTQLFEAAIKHGLMDGFSIH